MTVAPASDRPIKALEAARDVVKQLITIDAALLTFGVAFVEKITKDPGEIVFIRLAIVALLVSLLGGVIGLFYTVSATHSATGSVNDSGLRLTVSLCLGGFFVAIALLGAYIWSAPRAQPEDPAALGRGAIRTDT